jgi:Domain of unknown function (DUF1707)
LSACDEEVAGVVDPERLVSDGEREQAVAWLQHDLLAGRLTLEEFSQRIEEAYASRVQGDLERVRAGLPPGGERSAVRSRRRATRLTLVIFGRVVRRGRLKLRRWTFAGGAFCDIDLDIRQAEICGRRTAVNVLVGFGNVDVYVPENVNVTVTGLALGGHRREWGDDIERSPSPEIAVRAVSLFGTVDVWRVPADAPADYGEVFRRLEARQRQLPP